MRLRLLVLLLAAAFLGACLPRSSDEEQLRKLISSGQAAAEARDTGTLLGFVAADYRDSNGFDKTRLQNFLRAYFFTHPKGKLVVTLGEFEFPSDGLARVEASVYRVALSDPDRVRLDVEFRREGGRWQVSRVERLDQ